MGIQFLHEIGGKMEFPVALFDCLDLETPDNRLEFFVHCYNRLLMLSIGAEKRSEQREYLVHARVVSLLYREWQRNASFRQILDYLGGYFGSDIAREVADLVDESPVECLLRREPPSDLHQVEQCLFVFFTLVGIHGGDIEVDLLHVLFLFVILLDQLAKLIGVQTSPLGYHRAAFVNEIHARCRYADVLGSQRCNRRSAGIHTDIMDFNISMSAECLTDRKSRGDTSSQRVDEHIYLFRFAFFEDILYIIGVEVVSANISFEFKVEFFCHRITFLAKGNIWATSDKRL